MSSYILVYGDRGTTDCYYDRGEDPVKLIKDFDDYYEGHPSFKEAYDDQDAFLYELAGSAVEVQFKVEIVTKATPHSFKQESINKGKAIT